jgi:hypothetical protein
MSIADVDEFFEKNRILLDVVDGKIVVSIGKFKVETAIPEKPRDLDTIIEETMNPETKLTEEQARILIEGSQAANATEAAAQTTADNRFVNEFGQQFAEYMDTVQDTQTKDFLSKLWTDLMPGPVPTTKKQEPAPAAAAAPPQKQSSTKQTLRRSDSSRAGLAQKVQPVRAQSSLFPTSELFQTGGLGQGPSPPAAPQ